MGLQVRLAFGDVGEFVERYATNISDGGIFIRSRDPRPVGTRLAFELRLRNGEIAFAGEGLVRWVQGTDARGLGTPGMGLQFENLTDASREVLGRIIEGRGRAELPPAVEGASPDAWRPLDEFPPPPAEPVPEVADEPAAPPTMAPVAADGPRPQPEIPLAVARVLAEAKTAAPIAIPSLPPVVASPPVVAAARAPSPAAPPARAPSPAAPPVVARIANAPPPAPPVMAPSHAPPPAAPSLVSRIANAPPPSPPVLAPLAAPVSKAAARPSAPVQRAHDEGALTPSVLVPVLVPVAPEPAETTPALFGSAPTRTTPPGGLPMMKLPPAPAPPALPEPCERTEPMPSPAHSTPRAVWRAAVGMELGWSSIRVAVVEGAGPRVVPLGVDGAAMPAIVTDSGTRLACGEEARRAIAAGARGVRGVIGLLAQQHDAPATVAWRRRHLVRLAPSERGRAGVVFSKEPVPASALARRLVEEAKAAAEARLGASIQSAVLAVPTRLGDGARRALRDAAGACGLAIDRFVSAEAAAMLAVYGVEGRRRVLAIDFGEGSFSATVLEQEGHVVEVVASASDPELGGADLDLLLVEALLTQFEDESGLLVPEDPVLFERVREASTRAKEALSEHLETEVLLPDLVPAGLSRAELRQRVTRARLLALAAPFLDRALETTRAALAVRGFGASDLDELLLLGGQTRLGALGRRLAETLGKEPVRPPIAAEAAVLGAALVGAGPRTVPRHVLVGTVGAPVGVGLAGGQLKRLIERNHALPVERSYTAVTTSEGQREVRFPVFQGDRPQAVENELVGVVVAGPLPAAARGERRVTVHLALNEDGELTVRARDLLAGRDVPVRLERDATLADARRAMDLP